MMNIFKSEGHTSRITKLGFVSIIVVSVLVAILLASGLNNFSPFSVSSVEAFSLTNAGQARVSDSALAENTLLLQGGGRAGDGGNTPRAAPGKNYLPIIFLNSATAGGAWLLSGNAGTNPANDFLGTTDKVTFTIRVSNTVVYRIVPAVDPTYGFAPNIIGGFSGNTIAPNVYGATISGGGVAGWANVISSSYAFIGGGDKNTASGVEATIGGGNYNTAGNQQATVGGGYFNTANGFQATIGGGRLNTASGTGAFIGGGGYNGGVQGGNRAQGSASVIGGGISNTISITGSSAFIGGGNQNTASGLIATVDGGQSNNASSIASTIAGGITNAASGYAATVGGGDSNNASGTRAIIGGGFDNTASGIVATVSGGYFNTASGDGAFIGGGGFNGSTVNGNQAVADASTIGGGYGNIISSTATYAVIGGGNQNTAGGYAATIGGGELNAASGADVTIGGGVSNTASGFIATIGGGSNNNASGGSATVPGGVFNVASGGYSFAAGQQAHAINQGAFVWGDSTNAGVNSTANNQFIVRAAGGVKMVDGTNVFTTTSAALQVENATTYGEAAWLRLGSASNTVSVISLIKQAAGTGNFLQCYNESGGIFTSKCHIDSAGAFVGGSDFAEALGVVGDKSGYEPGDLVALNSAAMRTVTKANGAYDPMLIGVYSTRPGFIGADKNGATQVLPNEIPVALTGIVPVKVMLDPSGGAINIGDPLTSSSTPGIAMKATQAGKIIGYAMESISNDGMILALVQPGDYVPPAQLDALKQNAQLKVRVNMLENQIVMLDSSQSPFSNASLAWGVALLAVGLLIGRHVRF